MTGVVKSGCTVTMIFVYDCDQEDIGKTRTVADLFSEWERQDGVTIDHKSKLASALCLVYAWLEGKNIYADVSDKFSRAEYRNYLVKLNPYRILFT